MIPEIPRLDDAIRKKQKESEINFQVKNDVFGIENGVGISLHYDRRKEKISVRNTGEGKKNPRFVF